MHDHLQLAPARVEVTTRPDGTIVLRSPNQLGPSARCVTEWLCQWAEQAPQRTFLAERSRDGWRRVSYSEALSAVRRIARALLDRHLSPERPVLILSDNSVDHALLTLAALHVGVPVCPVSPAYSLVSKDFAKLKHIVGLVEPGLVWTADPERFAPALAAIGARATPLAELTAAAPNRATSRATSRATDLAHAAVSPSTIAKILFTSGSTDMPKGVVNTHGMLTTNQQMLVQGWPFIERRPPVLVDWLPWSHTFGGNHNFHLVLRNGGTLYIDGGKPAPGLIETSAKNLAEIAPTLYFNVPRGIDLLLPLLERDGALRKNFFSNLDALFYAAAALPLHLWHRLRTLATTERGDQVVMLTGWGSTETAPLAAQVHFPIEQPNVIGLPVAGSELKLVPTHGKLEVRVKGPHVMPGYWKRSDLTRAAFDDEGFYCIGDAVEFVDPAEPAKGLAFAGRVAENFKLLTGTWVQTGSVRLGLIAAGNPFIQDAVITGHDRDEIGALVFPSAAAATMAPDELSAKVAAAMRTLASAHGGSSMSPTRAMLMSEPPSIDGGEITDKGYLNQRAVLTRRAVLVEQLYAGGGGVIVP